MQLLHNNKTLNNWSWQNIQDVYGVLGDVLHEYEDIAERFELQIPMEVPKIDLKPGDVITVADAGHIAFASSWYRDVDRINKQINALDAEIKRRQQLIGVMG